MHIPQKYKFIVQLGKALHKYGVPSYKSQIYLTEVAEKKSITGTFMDSPTWINYLFYEEDNQTYNYVEGVIPGELNLGALTRIVEVTDQLIADDITFSEAEVAIEDIEAKPSSYTRIIKLIAFMLAAGSFCVILDTNWVSVAVATSLGALVYGINLLSEYFGYIKSVLESLVALAVTVITGLLTLCIDQIDISMTILASIIVFVPGLSITIALEEITSRSLVSGTAKLFDALVSLFKQFFGVVLGLSILPLFIDIQPTQVINDIPQWVDYIAILVLALSILYVLNVQKKDFLLCSVVGSLSYLTATVLDFTGLMVSIFVGTIIVVALSKLFSKFTRSPELIYLIPGIIMLVPGSKAFIGLSTVFIGSSETTSNMGEQVLYILMGIIGGLIFSGSFWVKRRKS